MTTRSKLPFARLFAALLPLTALAAGCTPDLSTAGQTITCSTDPDTGVILRCEPGAGDGAETCTDIDEDGDGEPHDEGTLARSGAAGDEDDDGVPDTEDCDEQPGEDYDSESSIDLPYNIKLPLGVTTTPILDAFAEKGATPAAIVSVTLDGGSWRLAELQASTPFVVTEADCSHLGNKATGRDRVVVVWENADGSTESDHMEIRYCER